jgi:hypothetical protein
MAARNFLLIINDLGDFVKIFVAFSEFASFQQKTCNFS